MKDDKGERVVNDPAPKPCPFCGNVGVTFITTQGDKWGNAECEHCGAIGPEVRTSYDVSPEAEWHQQAITEWNLRPNPETQPARDRGEPDAWLVTERDCTPAGSKVINTYATLKHYEVPSREILSKVPLYRSPVESVPVSALRELEAELIDWAQKYEDADNTVQAQIADRLSAVIRGTKT